MTLSLTGKKALVIGGSRGIGEAIVRRLSDDGASVAFTWVSSGERVQQQLNDYQQQGKAVQAFQADSGDAEQLTAVVNQAAEALGGIDILVYNAGILRTGEIDTFTLEDFDLSYNVNVRGPFVAVKAALPHFQSGGRIITLGSITSGAGRGAGSTVYGVTKAAVARLVRGLAWDLSSRKITVNDVQPGPVATDMNPLDGEKAEYLISVNPMKRFGEPREIANMVAWLAGPESSYVNGACITVDGGLTA